MGRATKLVDAAQSQFNPIRDDSIEYLMFEAIRNLDRRLEALEPKKEKFKHRKAGNGWSVGKDARGGV